MEYWNDGIKEKMSGYPASGNLVFCLKSSIFLLL